MTDALALAAELEQITATEWRIGCPQAKTYIARFPSQEDAERFAAQRPLPGHQVYAHRARGLDPVRQAAELLRAQHALLNRRSAAASRGTGKARLSVTPAEMTKIRAQLAALQARLENT